MPVNVALAIGTMALQAYSTSKQISSAKKSEKQQKAQLDLQRRTDQIRARRAARIKSAEMFAQSSGAGVSGDFVTGTAVGIQSELKGGINLSNQQYAEQARQLENQTDATVQGAFFDLAGAAVGVGAAAYTDGLFDTVTPEYTGVGSLNYTGSDAAPTFFNMNGTPK